MHGQLSVIGVTIIAFLPTDIVQLVSRIACVGPDNYCNILTYCVILGYCSEETIDLASNSDLNELSCQLGFTTLSK